MCCVTQGGLQIQDVMSRKDFCGVMTGGLGRKNRGTCISFTNCETKGCRVGRNSNYGWCGEEGAVLRRKSCWGEGKKPQWVTFCVPDEKDYVGIGKARLDKSESSGLSHF